MPKARDKVLGRERLAKRVRELQADGRCVVFTSGCYDLLHVGHLRSFEQAKSLGDALIVGVNRDRRVRELKGSGRPLVPERQRAELVAGLEVVQAVALFGEDDASALIRAVAPDIVCKGGEYRGLRIPEQVAVEAVGGRFHHLKQIPGVRTTNLIERASELRPRRARKPGP
jgi:rfaE bifunctional protein nucleotidyltransferase chain/domain